MSWPVVLNAAEPLDIVTFNVENLYDTVDDPGVRDETWLPLSVKRVGRYRAKCDALSRPWWQKTCRELDWSAAALREKIARLASVIRQSGHPPDILALQEVENIGVLHQLANALGGYPTRVLIPGRDSRGINVALLSRLSLEREPRRFAAPGKRGMLRVDLQPQLTLIVVHFPSPTNRAERRIRAWQRLQTAAAQVPPERTLIVLGDFNFPHRERAVFQELATPKWLLASEQCRGCRGTYYYGRARQWVWLDNVLLRQSAVARFCGVSVVNGLAIQGSDTPQRFKASEGGFRGVSDHWPLRACISR